MNQKVLDNIFIVHYCHPNCKPFQNIMRLPKEKAFALADKLAYDNPNTTAFYRFADFENYYPKRLKTDEILYQKFVALGGKPKEKHPLSFVLQGCDYLNEWFGNGVIYRIALKNVDSESVSFTLGDSCAQYERTGNIEMVTKEQLLARIEKFDYNIENFMGYVKENYSYIEVQVWNDKVIVL